MENSAKKLPKIRKATLKDAEELRNLYFEFMLEISRIDPFYRQDMEHWKSEDSLHDIVKDIIKKNRQFFLLEQDGRVIGFVDALVKKRDEAYKIWKTGHIEAIYVKPEFRKKGYSKMLVDRAMEWFQMKGMGHFTVGTYALDAKARKYWERLGFKEYFVLYHK